MAIDCGKHLAKLIHLLHRKGILFLVGKALVHGAISIVYLQCDWSLLVNTTITSMANLEFHAKTNKLTIFTTISPEGGGGVRFSAR